MTVKPLIPTGRSKGATRKRACRILLLALAAHLALASSSLAQERDGAVDGDSLQVQTEDRPAGEPTVIPLEDRAGLIRPLDLLRLDARFNLASPDLFSGWTGSGIYGFYGPPPVFMIDGMEVRTDLFGWQNLNMLPLSLEAVQGMESATLPGVAHGVRTRAGYLNLLTSHPGEGWRAGGDLYLGNESGDPGPWVYDSARVTPNVDRWGPDGSLHLAWSGSGWRVLAMGSIREQQPTDLMSHARLNNQRYLPETQTYHPIKITSGGGLLQAGYEGEGWSLDLQGMASGSADFPFVQAFGREVPAQLDYRQLSARIELSSEEWQYRGRWTWERMRTGYRVNIKAFDLDWSTGTHRLSLSAEHRRDGRMLRPGLLIERTYNASSSIDPGRGTVVLATPYLDGEIPLAPSSRDGALFAFQAGLDLEAGDAAPFLSAALRGIDPDAELRLFFEELLPRHAHAFGWWSGRGYSFPADEPIERWGDLQPGNGRTAGAVFRHRWSLTPVLRLSLEHRFLRHFHLGIPRQSVLPDPSYSVRPGLFSYLEGRGSRLLNIATLRHGTGPWKQELSLVLQHTLEGTPNYRSYWRQVPSFRMRYALSWQAATNTRLALETLVRGATRWEEYRALEGRTYRSLVPFFPQQTGTYHTRTPSWIDLGLSARQWLWERRLSLQLSMRNLLNNDIRMHPIGAQRSPILHLRAAFNLR
ncbi:MAG: hypothetical protein U5K31_07880 [Balneolaceae bacterium]|nr:hypothetical protein [Balneolaceae bacterium]